MKEREGRESAALRAYIVSILSREGKKRRGFHEEG